MPKYETSVQLWFYSEGASPSEVAKKLLALSFKPIKGAYDFVYMHSGEDMSESDLGTAILEISDALHKTILLKKNLTSSPWMLLTQSSNRLEKSSKK